MSDLSRTVAQEQLVSQDLHLSPTLVINLGHLSLDSETRSDVIDQITKACHDLGYFQVCCLRTLCYSSFPFHFVLSSLSFELFLSLTDIYYRHP